MAEHPNAGLIRQALEALNQGDLGAVLDMIADDAVFSIPGDSPVAGEYRGKAAIAGFLHHLAGLDEGSLRLDLHRLLTTDDEHVVAIWTVHGTRMGMSYQAIAGYDFRMRDGKIVIARNLQADQDAFDRFWIDSGLHEC